MQSERLKLSALSLADLELFTRINTNQHVRKFLWDDVVMSTESLREVLEKVESQLTAEGWGLWKIQLAGTDTVIGYAGLWKFFDEQQPQLLYALLPEYLGNGYATEASQLVIGYAFKVLDFSYLVASMDKPNVDSVKVCERLGFTLVEDKTVEGKPTLFYKLLR